MTKRRGQQNQEIVAMRLNTLNHGLNFRHKRFATLDRSEKMHSPSRPTMAERLGFEPRIGCPIHAFQACALNHSAISPYQRSIRLALSPPGRKTRTTNGSVTPSSGIDTRLHEYYRLAPLPVPVPAPVPNSRSGPNLWQSDKKASLYKESRSAPAWGAELIVRREKAADSQLQNHHHRQCHRA